jgi:hypothetical protein
VVDALPNLQRLVLDGCGGERNDYTYFQLDLEDYPQFKRKGLRLSLKTKF